MNYRLLQIDIQIIDIIYLSEINTKKRSYNLLNISGYYLDLSDLFQGERVYKRLIHLI
jgi:hypothetical protein